MTLDNSNILIFNVGPVPCCVSSDTVQVVIEPPDHITAIPGSNAFRPGLFSYRGKAVAVYDVRTKFNLPVDQRGKLLITTLDNRLSGFWIDNIEQITVSDQGRWQPLPIDCPRELFEAVFMIKEQLVFKTTFEALAKAQVNTRAKAFIQTLIERSDEKSALENKATTSDLSLSKSSSSLSQDMPKPAIIQPRQAQKAAETKPEQKKPVPTEKQKPITSDNALFNKPKTKEHTPASEPSARAPVFSSQPIKTNTPSDQSRRTPATPSTLADNKEKPTVTKKPILSYQAPSISKAKITTQANDNTENRFVNVPVSDPGIASKHHQTNHKSTGNLAALSFLILAFIIPAVGYYFYTLSDETTTNTKHSYKTGIRPKPSNPTATEQMFSSPHYSPQPVIATENKTTEEMHPVEIEPVVEITPLEPADDTNPGIDETTQQASIEQHQNEIVITINDSGARFNATQDEIAQQNTKTIEVATAAPEEERKAVTEVVIEKQINKKEAVTHSNRVIHIVVKGDTLWHIARRYIHDPFKYKQLARLSRIKNPDLIYPGNRIIIIIKNGK